MAFECSSVGAPGVRLAKAVLGSLVEHKHENEYHYDQELSIRHRRRGSSR